MGKYYTTEFKLQTLQPILGKNEYQRRARFYNILSNALVGTWLKRFKKKWHKRIYSPQTIRATAYETEICQMLPPPKTEEDRLRLRIL